MNKVKSVSFKVDSQTSKNLSTIKNYYSKDSKISRRVTNGEIMKQLINCHHEEITKHMNTIHLYEMRVKMLEKQNDR
tara:strand:+ start:1000 stop:1230 length:231 start_codon:yes stop_codon:yes gene_type:complete